MQKCIIRLFTALLFQFFLLSAQYALSQTVEKVVHEKKKFLTDNPQGFYNVTTFSIDLFKSPVINGMQSICGYRLNPYIAIGAGIGLERYVAMDMYDILMANLSLLPVFGEIRYTILNKRFSPVIALQGGYKFMLNESSTQVTSWREDIFPPFAYASYDEYDYYYEGGFSFTIEAGVRVKVYRRLAVCLYASYSVWTISGDHYKWVYEYLSAPGGQTKITDTYYTRPSMAYTQILLLRVGIAF